MSRRRIPRPPRLVHDGPYVKAGMLEEGKLFDHQKEALEALARWFGTGSRTADKTAVVVMPTGTGKTGVICCLPYYFGAAVSSDEMKLDLSKPILIIAPNLQIVDQLEVCIGHPENNFILKRGIISIEDCIGSGEDLRYITLRISHDLNKASIHQADIVLFNAQQWYRYGSNWSFPSDFFSVVIVDEAHHLPAKQWKQVVDKFGKHAKVCFFTATPKRFDGKLITSDLGACGVAYELSRDLAVSRRIIRKVSLTSLPFERGASQAYIPDDSELRLKFTYQVVDKVVEKLAGKNKEFVLPDDKKHQALITAKNISEAKTIADYANMRVRASVVHSEMPKCKNERERKKFKNGEIDIVVTVQMWLEGFDHPPISVVGIATHIKSSLKFAQFIGRAQRVVQSKRSELEDSTIVADIVTHDYFEQKDLFEHYINPQIPEQFRVGEPLNGIVRNITPI